MRLWPSLSVPDYPGIDTQMLTSLRNFLQSKVGMVVFIGFLVLVALGLAGGDISGGSFGGITPTERVALVGDDTITTSELLTTSQSALRNVQGQNPTVTMPQFVEDGGVEEVFSQLIDRYAIGSYAELAGLRAGENLVNSEILQMGAFRGVTGEFDQEVFERRLAEQRISEAVLRRDLADGLLAQQMLIPTLLGSEMPASLTRRYASLVLERRSGKIAIVPSSLFASEEEPDEAALEAYYAENRGDYVLPERRTLRFAGFSADNLRDDLTPTQAEIEASYEANKAQYAARESRDVTIFTVPTEEGARAIVEQIRGGKNLEAAARDAGFNTTQVVDRDQEQFASGASYAAAQAVFAAEQGAVAEPAQGTLGWYVARVDKITNTPERTLSEVTGEITEALIAQKRAAALSDLSARIEEEVDSGTALTEIADQFELTIEESPPLLADGRVFGAEQVPPNPALQPILQTAFSLDESQPQLDVLVPGSQFLIYDVATITESAAPPLAEIRERVARDLRLFNALGEAKEVAQRILEKTSGETSLQAAINAEEQDLPQADDVSLARAELDQLARRQNVPPALALMFSMTAGTIKLLEAPGNQGWILIALDEITPGEIDADNPILFQAQQQFNAALTEEYTEQLTAAMRKDVGVEENESALKAVTAQLSGES